MQQKYVTLMIDFKCEESSANRIGFRWYVMLVAEIPQIWGIDPLFHLFPNIYMRH